MTSENNQDMDVPKWVMVGEVPPRVGETRTVVFQDHKKPRDQEITSKAPWRDGCEAAIDAFKEAARARSLEKITEHQLDEEREALDAALKKMKVGYFDRIKIKETLANEALDLQPKTLPKIEFLKASPRVPEMTANQPEPKKEAAVVAPMPENPSIAKMRDITLPTPPTQKEVAQKSDLDGFRQHMRQRYACANNTEKGVLSNALRTVMAEEGVPAKTREAAIRDLLGLRAKRAEQNDWQERTASDASSAKVR